MAKPIVLTDIAAWVVEATGRRYISALIGEVKYVISYPAPDRPPSDSIRDEVDLVRFVSGSRNARPVPKKGRAASRYVAIVAAFDALRTATDATA